MKVLLALFLASTAWADSLILNKFSGLNNAVDPVAIEQTQMQDGLNVEANRTNTGIKKRDGYATALNVTSGGTGLTSGFAFKNGSGDECSIFADAAGNVKKSVNLTAPVAVTTITAGGRLWCQENNGLAYCYTSGLEIPFTYDCVTFTYKYTDGYPYGRASVFTLDRQVVVSSGSQFPNRAYFSKSGDFDYFTTGGEDYDAWTEDMGSAGDRLMGVYWLNGRLIFAKEYSILGAVADTQFDFSGYGICDRVGVANAEAMVIAGNAGYFKGTDNEFYRIDGSPSSCEKVSLSISSTTAQLLNGKSRYNIQTEYLDWSGGDVAVSGPGAPMSITQTYGSVEPSTVTLYDSTTAQWAQGTGDYHIWGSTLMGGGLFSTGGLSVWYATRTNASDSVYFSSAALAMTTCDWSPSTAEFRAIWTDSYWSVSGGVYPDTTLYIQDAVTDAILYARNITGNQSGCGQYSFDVSTQTSSMEMRLTDNHTLNTSTSAPFTAAQLPGGKLAFGYTQNAGTGFNPGYSATYRFPYPYYMATSTFTSRCMDVTFSTPTYGTLSVEISSTSARSATLRTKGSATCGGTYDSDVAVTSDGRMSHQARRYSKYMVNFMTDLATTTAKVYSSTLTAATTGQVTTQCISIGTGISAWGVTETAGTNTCGSIAYEASTGTACGSMQSFVAFSTGAVPSVDVGAVIKYRMTYSLNSATCTARLDSITTNWNEGSAPPPTVSTVWQDAAYWGVATSGSQNNRTLKLDLLSGDWFVFDIPMRSAWTWNNAMYFGGATSAKAFKYSDARDSSVPTSDDGAAINSYWHSKAFGGDDPFKEVTLDKISLVAKKQSGGTMAANWRMNGGDTASGSFTVNLSTGTNVVRHNYNVPNGSRGSFYDLKFSNNSTYPWEVLGIKLDFTPKDWRVMP